VVLVTSSPSDPHSKTGIRKVICGSPGAVFKPITTPGQGYSAFPRRSSSGNMRRSWGWSETDNAYATSPKPRHWDEKHEEVKPAFIRKSGRELDREVLRIAPKARNQSRPVLVQSRPVLDQSIASLLEDPLLVGFDPLFGNSSPTLFAIDHIQVMGLASYSSKHSMLSPR
jgi:hypothetical protein